MHGSGGQEGPVACWARQTLFNSDVTTSRQRVERGKVGGRRAGKHTDQQNCVTKSKRAAPRPAGTHPESKHRPYSWLNSASSFCPEQTSKFKLMSVAALVIFKLNRAAERKPSVGGRVIIQIVWWFENGWMNHSCVVSPARDDHTQRRAEKPPPGCTPPPPWFLYKNSVGHI